MSLNYYADFSKLLKKTREERGVHLEKIAEYTRIPLAYLESIERAEFDFATPVLIQGYLRQYARFIGLNEEAVVKQYGLILKKIDYVSSDHHLPPPFLETPPEPVGRQIRNTLRRSGEWIREHTLMHKPKEEKIFESAVTNVAEDPIAETAKLIDDEVARKWLAERRLTNRVTAFCICLLVLCFVFFFLDTEPPVSGSNETQEKPASSTEDKSVMISKKIRWNLTPALLTEEDLSEQERVSQWLEKDSQRIRQNLINQNYTGRGFPKPISVHTSYRYIEDTEYEDSE